MTTMVAFLRGVNLGTRKVLSPDLQAAFEGIGLAGAKTLLASGNVIFDADPEPGLAARIERQLESRFGFEIGTVLRTQDELRSLVAADPFGGRTENADLKLYVTLLAEPLADPIPMPFGVPGDFEVVRVSAAEIFHEAYRLPNGRFGPGAVAIGKNLGKVLWTNRNWNTIVRAAGL